MIDEYDVTFAVKEWLLKNGWDVVAFNPPGCQGTFTIPNPSKDPKYRGQTGSKAPDIIGVKKGKYILVVESKPKYSQDDVDKLTSLIKNKDRMNLLLRILKGVCDANDIPLEIPCTIILAVAHGGQTTLTLDMESFLVSTDGEWNPEKIDPKTDPYEHMNVIYKSTNKAIAKIVVDD